MYFLYYFRRREKRYFKMGNKSCKSIIIIKSLRKNRINKAISSIGLDRFDKNSTNIILDYKSYF